jgi:predicted nuclease of restriction endonuclease-like (RecB) superfamily
VLLLLIAARQKLVGWGTGVIPKLVLDLRNELPEQKGFSGRNLALMVQFHQAYPDLFQIVQTPVAELDGVVASGHLEANGIVQLPVAQLPSSTSSLSPFAKLPWAHNVVLMQQVKPQETRAWYAIETLEQGWSRDTLVSMIRSGAHTRQGTAINNFKQSLPATQSALAIERLKDPYIFDFLTIGEPFLERELETGLVRHIEKFLLELGRGFAFVGRQYHLEVSDKDFYLDLLFYHLTLRCFVVVDLKRGEFKPEYAGKMNFYCSAVDDQLKHATDAPTIGLILCQTKDRVLAEYALRDIAKPIGVSAYELEQALPETLASSLPSIQEIEAEFLSEGQSEIDMPDPK